VTSAHSCNAINVDGSTTLAAQLAAAAHETIISNRDTGVTSLSSSIARPTDMLKKLKSNAWPVVAMVRCSTMTTGTSSSNVGRFNPVAVLVVLNLFRDTFKTLSHFVRLDKIHDFQGIVMDRRELRVTFPKSERE
jgi:hypothetical protein